MYASYVSKTAMGTGVGSNASATINGFLITALGSGSDGNLINVAFIVSDDSPYTVHVTVTPDGNTIVFGVYSGATQSDVASAMAGGDFAINGVVPPGTFPFAIGNASFPSPNGYLNIDVPPTFLTGGSGGTVNYNS